MLNFNLLIYHPLFYNSNLVCMLNLLIADCLEFKVNETFAQQRFLMWK